MFKYLKPIPLPSVKLKKTEINKILKVARSQISINGLTSSHKYKVVKDIIRMLKEQNIPIPEDIKNELTFAAKAFLKDVLQFRSSKSDQVIPNPKDIIEIDTPSKDPQSTNTFLSKQLSFNWDMRQIIKIAISDT